MVGADGEKNDPNFKWMKPYLTRVPVNLGYPEYLEADLSLGQAWGLFTYRPNLGRGDLEEVKAEGSRLVSSPTSPYIRPAGTEGGEWILDFYSPYILVDGVIAGEISGGKNASVEVAFRSLAPKPNSISQPDDWLPWRTLGDKPGRFSVTLTRADAAAGESSFHGTYRWQMKIRLAGGTGEQPVGLSDLLVAAYFENGIMSIPQIFNGDNTIRFKVDDPGQVKGDIYVTHAWQTADGEKTQRQKIDREMFYQNSEAVYSIEAPGLVRCNSLVIAYP